MEVFKGATAMPRDMIEYVHDPKNSSWFFNTEAQRHKGTEVMMEIRIYRRKTRIARIHLKGELFGLQQKGFNLLFLCASVLKHQNKRNVQLSNLG